VVRALPNHNKACARSLAVVIRTGSFNFPAMGKNQPAERSQNIFFNTSYIAYIKKKHPTSMFFFDMTNNYYFYIL
jgi:hypothetical protein